MITYANVEPKDWTNWLKKYRSVHQDQINSYLMRPGSGVEFSESAHP